MIQLDVDLLYLTKHFQIGTKRINEARTQTIEEMMKAEAQNGNSKAANFDLAVLKNPHELLKVFKLSNARNRWKILKNMTMNDLLYLLQFLDHKDLVLGLKFFTKDKLLKMTEAMPKKNICQVVFGKVKVEKFLNMIPEQELDKFFDSEKVNKGNVLRAMKKFSPLMIQNMMEGSLGIPMKNKSKGDMLGMLAKMPPDVFKETIKGMEAKHKIQIIMKMTEEDPKLLMEFSKEALMMPLEKLQKPDLIDAIGVLKPEDLTKMIAELPKDLLSVVCSQIDPKVFSEVLCDKFQDILSKIAVGN